MVQAFNFAPEYDAQARAIQRNLKLAEMLQQQALTPSDPNRMVGGYVVRTSPLEGITKLAQSWAAGKMQDRADNELRRMNTDMESDTMSRIDQAMRLSQGTPQIPAPSEELGGGPGKPAMPGDRKAAYAVLAGAQNPGVRQMALAQMLKAMEPAAPIKMGKGDRLVSPTNYETIVAPTQQPKIQRVEIPDGKGGQRVGFVDMNNPDPMSTFREGGVQPAKAEILPSGQAINPYQVQPGQTFQDPNKPFTLGQGGQVVPNTPFQQYELGKARAGATNVTVDARERARTFEWENKIRDDFKADPRVKAADEMNSAFKLIETANARPSPANDLALATKYMKILDPTSVVRESELGMALAATGLMDRVQSYVDNILSGKKLNPAQRADFYESAKKINEAFQSEVNKVAQEYQGIARQYQLNPGNVTPGRSGGVGLPSMDMIDHEIRRRQAQSQGGGR